MASSVPPFLGDKTRPYFSQPHLVFVGQDAEVHKRKKMDNGRSGRGNRGNRRRNGCGNGNNKRWKRKGRGRRGGRGKRGGRGGNADDNDRTPRWDAKHVNPAAPPPALSPADQDAILASATFTSPFSIVVSKAAPEFSSNVPGVASKRLLLYQHVVFQGWTFVVSGHVYVDVVQNPDGGWSWSLQDVPHGLYLSRFLHMSGNMTSVQNHNAFNVFVALITAHPDVSSCAAGVQDKSSVPILGVYPGSCTPDPRVPCRVVADPVDAPDTPGPSTPVTTTTTTTVTATTVATTTTVTTTSADGGTDADADTDGDNADLPDQ